MPNIRSLADLKSEYLSEVIFVMDYIQLGFNGPCLNIYSDLVIESSGESFRFPAPGSRDALCSFIGSTLIDAQIITDQSITLLFSTGTIQVFLDAERRGKGEAAEFWSNSEGGLLMDW